MGAQRRFAARLFLTCCIFILVALVFFTKAGASSRSWIFGFILVIIPTFIFIKSFEDIYNILSMLNKTYTVKVNEYRALPKAILKYFGLLPVFELLDKFSEDFKVLNFENQLLCDTTSAIHASSSLNQLLVSVISRLVAYSGADFGVVFLFDAEKNSNELQASAFYNLMETDLNKKIFQVGEGIVGSVAKEGKAILLQDAEKDRRYVICVHGTRSQMTVPLKAGSEVLGVILLGSYEVEKFKNKDIILLNNIAGEIGLAINNVWLTRKLKEEKESVVILYETAKQLAESIDLDDVAEIGVKTVYGAVDAISCSLMLWDIEDEMLKIIKSEGLSEDTERLVKLRPEEGIAGRVFQEGKPILVKNVFDEPKFKEFEEQGEELKSFYSVPLKTKEGCIGTINVDTSAPLTEDKCKVVDAIASQVSVAMGNALLYKSVKRLAIKDGLTGLYNHRYFHQTLEEEFERARRYGRDVSLAIIDVDNFKKYNDHYGHLAGDYLLSKIGNLIQEDLRGSDILARYGGDELAIILPETGAKQALDILTRIKNKIGDYSFSLQDYKAGAGDEKPEDYGRDEYKSGYDLIKEKFFRWFTNRGLNFNDLNSTFTMQVTISAGICELYDEIADKNELIKKADQALLQAKRNGKNRICLWE